MFGTVGFVILGNVTFRFAYGAWPPFEGNFGQWLSSDSRARWCLTVAVVGGMVGALIGRALTRILAPQDAKLCEALECANRGLLYHEQKRIQDAINMFRQAIEIYTELGRINDAAPVYGSLGKVYFDNADLGLAEDALNEALTIYKRRPRAQEAIDTITRLLDLIWERRQESDAPSTYTNAAYGFSFTVPVGWLKQRLVQQFADTGGQIAIAHKRHRATFNVSVGPPDRPEWIAKEARVSAVRNYLGRVPQRIGEVDVRTSLSIDGEANTVSGEFEVEVDIRGVSRKRRNGLISIIHKGSEYALQWSVESDFEQEVKAIIDSFRFTN